MKQLKQAMIAILSALALGACAVQDDANKPEADNASGFLLLGEIHDNAQGHEQRLDLIRQIVSPEEKVTLVLEQFPTDPSKPLSAITLQCETAQCVIDAAGGQGWDWPLYEPLLEHALENGWVLVSGNVTRKTLMQSIQGGVESALDEETQKLFRLHEPVPDEFTQAQVQSIVKGHCGLISKQAAQPMINAQIVRDLWMARQMLAHRAHSDRVILIAGNGHIRQDIGVPFWLQRAGAQDPFVVAFLEATPSADSQPYSTFYPVEPADREDPCEKLKAHFSHGAKSSEATPSE